MTLSNRRATALATANESQGPMEVQLQWIRVWQLEDIRMRTSHRLDRKDK
jgi:hypothetical protein